MKAERYAVLGLLLALLTACASGTPPGLKTFQSGRFSLTYPAAWVQGEQTDNTILLSTQPGETQALLLGDDLQSGQSAILLFWSGTDEVWNEWKAGLSSADMRRHMIDSMRGQGARFGYTYGEPAEQTLGGHPVSVASLTRHYTPEPSPSSSIDNEGLVLALDLGEGFTVQMTCHAVQGEFEQFRDVCMQVAESLRVN